jgi:hypothetical protein
MQRLRKPPLKRENLFLGHTKQSTYKRYIKTLQKATRSLSLNNDEAPNKSQRNKIGFERRS